ncbi:MAG: Lrp/AsnC family transcriptional regulator [Nanoarchaeota archaeon]|nr:Lrp/AsnC family transcriptional regulator [Nanoarchaeota archaeon]MBU1030866.1 Lrp/AsnC family transcriptional regulator [Nanoarchaeota archaeon]MBU1850728.1 Lrp/AsnC family transcriptional regulator [Nanoarchaeota archaeon]
MNKKISKLIFSLSINSRISTNNLSKQLRISQQSASYLVNQLKKKKIIQGLSTIVDPIKLGFLNVFVGVNFVFPNNQTKKEIIIELKKIDSIILIQEASQGVDLLLEYCVNNLSAFNKLHSEIEHKFHKAIETKFIFPVVVKHLFEKTYLGRKPNTMDVVICGDREIKTLNENEEKVLKELINQTDITFTKIAQKTNISTKTIVHIKKKLERKQIIRGYTCWLNNKKLNINKDVILIALSGAGIGEINKLVEYARNHKNIIEIIKIIGPYHLMLIVESFDKNNIINEFRGQFLIKEYFVINIESTIKKEFVPKEI